MNVGGASSVVTGESCVELQDSVLIGELDATEHRVVDVASIGSVAVAVRNNASVHTSAVAVPRLEGNLRDRLASRGVDNLDIERQGHTRVAVSNILTDILARNPCRKRQSWKVSVHEEVAYSMDLR